MSLGCIAPQAPPSVGIAGAGRTLQNFTQPKPTCSARLSKVGQRSGPNNSIGIHGLRHTPDASVSQRSEGFMQSTFTISFYVSAEPEVFDMPTGEDISGRCSSTTTTCCCVKIQLH